MTSNLKTKIVGIIPAAGKGSRLYPFPCPKELFPVGYQDYLIAGSLQKRPKVISQYLIENIINAGAKRLVFILGEEKYEIMRYYNDGTRFGADIAYLFQEKLLGMPYAINQAKNWVNHDTVLFGMPDTIIEPRDVFQQLLTRHQEFSADLTLGLFPTENPSKFGMVDFDNSDTITFIVDKPQKTTLKYAWGCGCWSASFTQLLDDYLKSHPYEGHEVVLGDVFLYAVRNNLTVKAVKFDHGRYIDIGTVDELDAALKKFHLS
jgi:glucose-1-phosphate thymidylyltransferase